MRRCGPVLGACVDGDGCYAAMRDDSSARAIGKRVEAGTGVYHGRSRIQDGEFDGCCEEGAISLSSGCGQGRQCVRVERECHLRRA